MWIFIILALLVSGCIFPACPECPQTTEWTNCTDFQQTRIIYYCNSSTNFKCVSVNESRPCIPSQLTGQYVQKNYSWSFKNKNWFWQPIFPLSAYNYFKNKPRPATNDYSVYATDPIDDQIIAQLVGIFKESGFEKYDMVEFVAAFIQNLPYIPDNATSPLDEWPKYPLETLVDGGGDCEDSSILAAVLLNEIGFDVVLIALPNHMGIGIRCDGNGTYFVDNYGNKYCYLETTGRGWKIGQLPDEYRNKPAKIYYLVPKPVLNYFSSAAPISYSYNTVTFKIDVRIWNEGTAEAKNITIWVGFDVPEQENMVQNQTNLTILQPGQNVTISVPLTISRGRQIRLHVSVWADNVEKQESFSEWSQI
jgi:hypothetical protein